MIVQLGMSDDKKVDIDAVRIYNKTKQEIRIAFLKGDLL